MMGRTTPSSRIRRPFVIASSPLLGWLLSLTSCYNNNNYAAVVEGHGYLVSPRSRNLLANEEIVWWPQTENDPEPETCPHCLNRGGSLARCGLVESAGGAYGNTRNYDAPRNALGGLMPPTIQATYDQGSEIIIDVTLTAHHKGHFVFSACPISVSEVPSQQCFDQHRLTFVEDMLHGANYDANYPERAYIAPVDDPNYVPDLANSRGVMDYSFKMRLPPDLYGDLVLIQWYYLTANSCYHEGYQEYDWPTGWNIHATSSMPCGPVSPDGTGSPEQFWNCAEVKIVRNELFHEVVEEAATLVETRPTPPAPGRPAPVVDISSGIAIPVGLPSSSQSSNGSRPSSAGSHGKTIVGYYASWQWYDRNKLASPANMDFTKVQRVNFAFFQSDAMGNIWGTDAWGDPNVLFGPYNWNPSEGSTPHCSWDAPNTKACNHHIYEEGLIHRVHAAGAEIYPSLGGWTLSDPFPAMAASASARATFARNCVDMIMEYGFDGIDLDWEYPGFEEHSGTPQDRANFRLLLDDLRAALDTLGSQTGIFYGLTAALPCGPRHIANMDIAHVASTLSELNLMTYDFHGAFSETTGINAPLYYQGWGEEDFDVDSCVKNWLAGGGSVDKINIGLPFYGRSFAGATGLNQPHSGADQTVWGIDDGTPQYFNIVAQLPFMTSVWDETTWTQYAFFADGGLVSYDNENAICAKVQYAIENKLNGFIIWELSGDMMDDMSTPLLDITNAKLHDPNLICGEPGFYPESAATETNPTIVSPAVPPPGQAPASASSWGVPPTPVTFPISPSPASFPEILEPSEPVVNQPVVNQPVVNQPVVNQPVNNQEVNDQNQQPANGQPTHNEPLLLLCGNQQTSSINANGSKPLELSFRYELHRNPNTSEFDALKEFKTSLLNGLAGKLQCSSGATSSEKGRRGLLRSNNILEASQESVLAIESTESDLPVHGSTCSIPVQLNSPTVCLSVVGAITARVKEGTPAGVLSEMAEELLFFIRTSMAAGSYESSQIKKVIFVENLSSPLESNSVVSNTANVVWVPDDEGGSSPMFIVVLCFLVVLLIGVAIFFFIFVTKKKRDESRIAEVRTIIDINPDEIKEPAPTIPAASSTEEALRRALDAKETWRKALDTYNDESVKVDVDPDKRKTPSDAEQTWKKIKEAFDPNGLSESQGNTDNRESVGDNIISDEPKKVRKRSKAPTGELQLEPNDDFQASEITMEEWDPTGYKGDSDVDYEAMEPIVSSEENSGERVNNEDENQIQDHLMDEYSSASSKKQKLDSALDSKKDEENPASTIKQEVKYPQPDSILSLDDPEQESLDRKPEASKDQYKTMNSADYGLD